MRRASFPALASLASLALAATGCANGSSAESEDLASDDPIVALSDPRAAAPPLPELGRGDRAAQRRATAITFATPNALGGASASALATCKKNAFCDDFEEALPASRWTTTVATAGAVDFPGPSLGSHVLRAVTSGAGSAAYLTRDGGAVASQWVGVLELSLRVDALPVTGLGGPEIAVVDANGASTRIGFSIRPDGLALHQLFEACTGSSCAARSDLVSDVKAGEWRRVTVAIETYGTSAPPFGRVEVTVDGGDLIVLPLTVTPFGGRVEARAGITIADDAPSTARVDDVTFYARAL